ncbi:response regulator transcription factor [Chryseobacterium caseinilyticum]|uniref:Response regulator transcription factor n=1 Tax=Chryseobacterium caseinilyticum TaxID=2771428 RepID=A0ABR8ZFG6_9FLAO|nr:response regulator transcription factor [Chryseobacterium caseinilyticum]MBD8084038.1 response regulator transcription factor [Chryseobacterium caseinilyticum]
MNETIKLALVDDEQLILEGVKMLLSSDKQIKVTFTANDGAGFLKMLEESSPEDFPDIVLSDIQMLPMDGFELVEILKNLYPDLKIIILSSHYKTSVFGHMIKLGVSAFLPKNSDKKTFLEAIKSVHSKGVYLSEEDLKMLATFKNNVVKQKSLFTIEDELSEREKDVVQLICQEFTNKEIAEKLFISPRTVESHRQRIIEKLGVKNSIGIVIYAIIHDIFAVDIRL